MLVKPSTTYDASPGPFAFRHAIGALRHAFELCG